MTRRVLVFLSLVALAACSKEPSAPSDQSGGPTFVISDAGHSGGRPDFGWRPPIANTTLLGTFDGNRHPNVRICVLNATADGCTGADVFTATDVPVINMQCDVDHPTQTLADIMLNDASGGRSRSTAAASALRVDAGRARVIEWKREES